MDNQITVTRDTWQLKDHETQQVIMRCINFLTTYLQVSWPNQVCQSTEGGWLVIQIALSLTRLTSQCHSNTASLHTHIRQDHCTHGTVTITVAVVLTLYSLSSHCQCTRIGLVIHETRPVKFARVLPRAAIWNSLRSWQIDVVGRQQMTCAVCQRVTQTAELLGTLGRTLSRHPCSRGGFCSWRLSPSSRHSGGMQHPIMCRLDRPEWLLAQAVVLLVLFPHAWRRVSAPKHVSC